jgi:hypothetical protein
MKRGPKPAIMVIRMKPLPRRHRIAHLSALARSIRREELFALLRDELSARPDREMRTVWAGQRRQENCRTSKSAHSDFTT